MSLPLRTLPFLRANYRSTPTTSVLLVALAIFTAASCGGAVDTTQDEDTPAEAGNRAPLASVQELVIATGGDPWVDSQGDRKRLPSYPLNADVCDTLVRLGPDYGLEPGLANDWAFVGNNSFRFTLRDGTTFSDGSPVNSEAVDFTIDYTVQEPEIGTSSLGFESTTIIDERTVEIRPESPNLRVIEEIAHPTYSILAPGSDPLNDPNVTCSGPFRVKEYIPEEQLVVERNDQYWGEAPVLDTITFRFIPDATTRTLSLQTGEVDLITDVPRSLLSSLEDQPGIKFQTAPVGQVTLIKLARRDAAGSEKVLADPLMRRAVAHAIDREGYLTGVLDGNGESVSTIIPPRALGDYADLVEGVRYDPNEAADLLDRAGWALQSDGSRSKDGRRLELTMILGSGGGGTAIELNTAEYIQAELGDVGIQSKIEQLDAGAYSERRDSGAYDLDFHAPNQNDANPAGGMARNYYFNSPRPDIKVNAPGADTEFESLIDATDRATDRDELQRLSAEAMHQLVDVEIAAIPLAGTFRIYGLRDEVEGLVPHPSSTNQRWSSIFIRE